jgi:hypothetical protein
MWGGDETQPYEEPTAGGGFQEPPTTPWHGSGSGVGDDDPRHWPVRGSGSPPPGPLHRDISPLIWLLIGAIVLVAVALGVILLGGHLSSSSTIRGQSGTSTPAGNSTPLATTTAAPQRSPTPAITVCTQLADFAHAGAATTGSRHVVLPFPADSVSISGGGDVTHEGYQQRVLHVCTPNLTASTVPATFGQQMTAAGWQAVVSSSLPQGITCGQPCWQFSAPPDNPQSKGNYLFYAGLGQMQTVGGVVTYAVQFAIAPYTSGTGTLDALHPTFSADQGSEPDLQYLSVQQVMLVDNALYAPIPNNQFDITYKRVGALDYTNNQGVPIQLNQLAAIALQGNRPKAT